MLGQIAFMILLLVAPATAFEYPCPSDPKFCYFDVANDGCYDPPNDLGPIDAQLETGEFPSPLPSGNDLPTDPGSIVCPPSVKLLTANSGTDYRTALGGDIVFHRARIRCGRGSLPCGGDIDMSSGGRILLGGRVDAPLRQRIYSFRLEAEDEIVIERGFLGTTYPPGFDTIWTSKNASIEIGTKAKFRTGNMTIDAATDLILGHKVRFDMLKYNHPASVLRAGGDVVMSSPSFRNTRTVTVEGAEITVTGPLRVRSYQFAHQFRTFNLNAPEGDVTVESINMKVPLSVVGDSVSIGGAKKSKLRVKEGFGDALSVAATGPIRLRSLDAIVHRDITIATTGTELDIVKSRFRETEASSMTILTGAGSTCDFQASSFETSSISQDCGTVFER